MEKKKILIADDEPNNLQLLRQILKEDYTLVFAKNGKEAIEQAQKHEPDLILLDIMMPEMDGYSACEHIKNIHGLQDIPVVFVTAMSDVDDEQQGFELGGVDYITKPVSAPVVKARVKTHLSLVQTDKLQESQKAAIHMLGEAGHFNDTDTGVHIWRMAAYSRALAEFSGWSPSDAELMELAAPMHDTGKIGIKDSVLKKPAKLTDEEWVHMKRHTEIGFDILSKSPTPLFQMAAVIALYHHERWDGKGYPHGLVGDAIPEAARIVAIADVFDALTMRRPYKEAWPVEKAIEEIRRSGGSHLDPNLVELFCRNIDRILEIKAHWDKKEEQVKRQSEHVA